jgi:hypothetical protein
MLVSSFLEHAAKINFECNELVHQDVEQVRIRLPLIHYFHDLLVIVMMIIGLVWFLLLFYVVLLH